MRERDPIQQAIDLAVIEVAEKHAAADRRELGAEVAIATWGKK